MTYSNLMYAVKNVEHFSRKNKMDEEKRQKKIDFFSEKSGELNNLEKTKLFEEISVAISNFVQCKDGDNDSTDGIFDTLSEIP